MAAITLSEARSRADEVVQLLSANPAYRMQLTADRSDVLHETDSGCISSCAWTCSWTSFEEKGEQR
jgi:hypothetical protein